VTGCAKTGRLWKQVNSAQDLAWYGGKLKAEENIEADRIRDLGNLDREKARAYADALRGEIAANAA
jgi:hypothetical protein